MNVCEACSGPLGKYRHRARFCMACYRLREAASRTTPSRYQYLAHRYVEAAIRHGDLPKLDGRIACVDCGIPAAEYDHRDYKKPMEVDPVCRACNNARGPALHRDPTETGKKPPTIVQRFNARGKAA